MAHFDDAETTHGMHTFIRKAMSESLLSKEEEFALATAWKVQGDERAMHKLIEAHTRLVVSIAAKFRHYGLPNSDLVQEGNMGLMQAALRFEPDRDIRFSTYATWWVKSCIQDFVLRNWSIVRTGTTSAQKSLFFNLRRLRAKIEEESEEDLNGTGRQKIATDLAVPLKDVEEMEMRLNMNDQSLNTAITIEGDDSYQDFLADTRETPEEIITHQHTRRKTALCLKSALDSLTEREQMIIRRRKLADTVVTLEDLGKELGISKERVRQLESRALEKMKYLIQTRHHEGTEYLLP